MGAIATLMILGFQLIAAGADGQGLSNAVVIAVVLFYGSVAIGAVAALLGIAAAIFARPRLLGVVAIVLGVIPVFVSHRPSVAPRRCQHSYSYANARMMSSLAALRAGMSAASTPAISPTPMAVSRPDQGKK